MSKRRVFWVWALTLLVVGNSASAVWYFLEKERLSREKESLLEENADLNNELLGAGEENKKLNQRIKETVLEVDRLTREYNGLLERYDKTLAEKDNLAIEVKGLNELKIILAKKAEELRQKLLRMREDKVGIEKKLKAALQRLEAEEIAKVQAEEVELQEIVVRAKPEKAPSEQEGKVIAVSDGYNFVVIDLGENDGVEEGMRFGVYRRDRRIGGISVIELRKHLAAANVEDAEGQIRLEKDDVVKLEE